jgi:hypothetical protein
MADNSKYMPIDHIEKLLDETFSGLWSVRNFKIQVIVNEIVGILDLEVFHPTAHVWLFRTGTAAKMIQQKSGSAIDDINAKYKNALEKDVPALKAECIKNAAKGLGVSFGRNLNRGSDGNDYHSLSDKVTPQTEVQNQAIGLLNDSNLNDKAKAVINKKILSFSDEAITNEIIPYIIKNSTL